VKSRLGSQIVDAGRLAFFFLLELTGTEDWLSAASAFYCCGAKYPLRARTCRSFFSEEISMER